MSKSTLILLSIIAMAHAQLDMLTDRMDFEDNIAEESSHSDEQIFVNAISGKPLLNDGKPFYVARDPQTGTLDFNSKKTVGIQNDIPVNRKDEVSAGAKSGHDINSLGNNNFHDYLNLPVKYSSSKFVVPMISGSYANMKYQGNNKNQVSNHKNYTTTLGTTTQSPKYFTHITATFKQPETTQHHVIKITTHRPTTTTTEKVTTTTQSTTPQTTQSSTVKYSSTIVQQNSFPSTFKSKYVDSSETRKKTTPEVLTSSTQPANPVRFLDDILESVETRPTTYRPPFDATRLSFSTSMPLVPSGFRPMPTEAPANEKISFANQKTPKNPSIMSLSEIINSITGNENSSNEQNSIQYDTSDSSQVEVRRPAPTTTTTTTTTTPPPQKTLQQMQQQVKPQFVDLPVHQQNFAPPGSHVGFPSDEQFEDYVEFDHPEDQYASQYVKYEVEKPNVNLVKFQQIPSMNNVVISPGQNSASFVLGSQQSVGSVGVGSSMGVGTSHFADTAGPMKVGQVINDAPPARGPATNQIQASIRFPSDVEGSFENAQIVKGTIKLDGSAESVQPPQALSQNTPAPGNQLVFPKTELRQGEMNAELSIGKPAPNPSQLIFESVNDIYERVNEKKIKQGIASNEITHGSAGEPTPPQVLTPPSPTQNRPFIRQHTQPPPQFMRRPGPPRQNIPGLPNILPQFRPNAKASQGHPHMYKDVGAIRVPMHHGPNPYNRQYQSPVPLPKSGLPPMPPQNMRRMPNRPYGPGPNQFNHGPSHPPQFFDHNIDNGNRRVFRVPPPQANDRVFVKPPPISHPGFQLKRPQGQPETMQMQQRPSNIPAQNQQPQFNQGQPQQPQFNQGQSQQPHFNQQPQFNQGQPQPGQHFQLPQPQHLHQPQQFQQSPDFELNKSSPPPVPQQYAPRPIESDDDTNGTSLEPVITLQMLQNKKGGSKLNLPPVPHDIPQDIQSPIPSNHKADPSKKPSIYVVYPVTSNSYENSASQENSQDASLVIANRGDSLLPGASEYQNTPFSVVSHFEQEPLLMKKDKKKNQFPYHLERPAQHNEFKADRPTYDALHDGFAYNTGEEPTSSRVVNKPDAAISSKLTRVTEKPIAIAYTPTEPNRSYPPITNFYHSAHPHHHYSHHYDPHLSGDKPFSSPNYGGPVISEILDEKHVGFDYYHQQHQLQQHLNNGEDLDVYKEHYDFQAPFQASVSVNPEVTNPYEGWSIITKSPESNNKIDRVDLNVGDSSEESTTKKFDPNEFQPIFESGFQPIYSENKVSTAPKLILQESSEIPSTLALTFSTPQHVVHHPTTPLPTTSSSSEASFEIKSSEETTTKKVEKKKIEIDSLEAFFESLTRDYDDDESSNKSENETRSL